jgi:hypothetical protein
MKDILKIFILAAAILLAGCIADPNIGTCPDPTRATDDGVLITVSVPGHSVPQTRAGIAGADGEAVVETLDVLVFEKDGSNQEILTERVAGKVTTQSTSAADRYRVTFTAKLADNPDANMIVVIANATGDVTDALAAAPATPKKQDILAKLQHKAVTVAGWEADDSDNFTPIPMYGEQTLPATGVTAEMKISDIELTRMLARIDVVNSAADFTVTKIYLWGRRNMGYIAPAWNSADGAIASVQPAAPVAYGGLYNSFLQCHETTETDLANFTGRIYTYEAPATDGVENSTAHQEAACLIIGGKRTGDATVYFYRVDFTDPVDSTGKRPGEPGYDATKLPAPGDVKYMPLWRNHLYQVTITEVDGPGYTSMDDARNSLGVLSNLRTEMHVVDQSGVNDLVFDGQHWLGTDESLLVFRAEGGTRNLDARTNYFDGWEAANIKYGATGGSGWLSPQTSGNGEDGSSATVEAGVYAGTTPRTATFELTAGRLRKTITVIQLPSVDKVSPETVIPNSYVGAFWKAGQTGERLIRFPRPGTGYDGAWTATVIEGEEWITLDKEMTTDANVGWRTDLTPAETSVENGNDAGFDLRHKITDGRDYVAG